MGSAEGHPLTDTDFQKLWKEAQSRWLRPVEVYDILHNHFRFQICTEPPNLPPSGTLILFNRKVLRNFRRDGHPWKKKKDNKTVKEAHEHLKVGSEEKIHVYYAHGEGGSNLQRRVYWLLEKTLEHIVLVHYLDVKEGILVNRIQPLWLENQSVQQGINSESSAEFTSTQLIDFSEFDSNGDFDSFPLEEFQSKGEMDMKGALWLVPSGAPTSESSEGQRNTNKSVFGETEWDQVPLDQETTFLHDTQSDGMARNGHLATTESELESHIAFKGHKVYTYTDMMETTTMEKDLWSDAVGSGLSDIQVECSQCMHASHLCSQISNGEEVFKKLDSLDRWMRMELPDHENSPLTTSVNSSSYNDVLIHEKMQNDTKETSYLPCQLHQEKESVPLVCPPIMFKITEYSPTWGFSHEEVKVIVIGEFVGDPHYFSVISWGCMFGDLKVPAEIIQPGILRCKTPKAGPGKVFFFVTDGQHVCSDVKEFEFYSMPAGETKSNSHEDAHFIEDFRLQMRFAQLLLSNPVVSGSGSNDNWAILETLCTTNTCNLCEAKEQLIKIFLKNTLLQVVSSKDKRHLASFDKHGLGMLHLASALGYDWVIDIIMSSGMSINYRDKKGWTALHWAAYNGREKMVAALLAAGALPGAISDPTPDNPMGCKPAEVASSAGYDGIAGYLSEYSLSDHLESLTLQENEQDKLSANEQGNRVVEYLRRSASLQNTVKTFDDELSLEESLSAMCKATTAAARIHAAFRYYSLKARLHAINEADEYGLTLEEKALIAAKRIQRAYRSHHDRKIKESAALQIQNRYRGWKKRREFVSLRQKVVKIQAYFRMRMARKQYYKIIWSVGVLEKALLRWRQRRKGLRGFQSETMASIKGVDNEDFLEIGRKQVEQALDRSVILVQSMVRSPDARQQYKRMLENFNQAKVTTSGAMKDARNV